ncbi:amino acid adenylation domain-containing protein, partial [Pseudomonas costantinii]|uniref:amino acid adenylation domain-containing protein n=1 Tax=Pseudomonas costantinii TaxID=168469 RepID=UPI003F752FCD
MSVIELLATLKEKDVQLSVKGDQLVLQGNKLALSEPGVLASLREHKAALIALINAGDYSAQRTGQVDVPTNAIAPDCPLITPAMLPLVNLNQTAIDRIVAMVPGGTANVQDIYPLAALQEGIFYHHVTARQGDLYLMRSQFAITTRPRLEAFAQALQQVINRHDILRTSIAWEGLDEPVQVVWRQSQLVINEVALDPAEGPITEQLYRRFDTRAMHMHLDQAPLLRVVFAEDPANQRWVAMLLFHHIAIDHVAMQVVYQEIHACLYGGVEPLGAAVPYRNYVAQARLGTTVQEHEGFFRDMLGDLDEPTLPFGHQDVQGDEQVDELVHVLGADLSRRLRAQARQQVVSVASLHHLAWAQVLGRISGRDDVVFGTVLMGRMGGGEGSERGLGLFINTLPLRLDVGALDVQAAAKAAHVRLTRLLGHEHAPLALAQRCSGVAAPTPLFSALINYRQSQAPASSAPQWDGIELLGGEGRSNYPLVLSVDDVGEDFNLTLQGVASMPLPRILGYMLTALHSLVDALEQGHATPMQALPIVPADERDSQLAGFNNTARDYPRGQTIHALFEARALALPQAVAVRQGEQQLSYQQLNEQANQLARHLIEWGVGPDDRIAICARRSVETLVGLLAILKAGAAYVPVDPAHPQERIAYLLQDSAPVAVLVQTATAALVTGLSVPVIDLNSNAWHAAPADNPKVAGLTPAHLAYVIYTSGSTGQPKGVMVEHQTLENLVNWHCDAFELHAGSHTSSVAGFGFDAMAWEVWPALCAGATLHLPPAQQAHEDIDALLQWWVVQPLDVSFLPTPVAEYAFSQHLEHPTLKTLLIGGDRLRQFNTPRRFNLVNNYGPTEATVVATSGLIEAGKTLHIGKPVANAQVYVLDAQQQLLPQGVAGELYVAGAGVARGYLNREQMTAERFLKDPFSCDPQARMYRTGDLVRWREDGTLEYLGRNDDQVKIRGVRIELGEIESRLGEQAQIREAVVLARDGRLVAYFTEHFTQPQPVDIEALRSALQAQLPEYMVPAAYVRLDNLPLTANGKLDRQALPEPGLESMLSRGYAAPQGELETTLAQIWADVLKVEQVGRHDHFFELGGHSLLAVNLVERMRQAGLQADVRVLFSQPTLAALAAAVGSGHEVQVPANLLVPGLTHITPDLLPLARISQANIDLITAAVPGGAANVQDIYPLAPLQEGILYLHLSAAHRDPYVLKSQFAFADSERLQAFCQALQQVVERHDILRTAVLWEGLDQPMQVVLRHAQLPVEQFMPTPGPIPVAEQLRADVQVRYARLNLNQAPLMRVVYAHDAASGKIVAFFLFHHLVLDHTAVEVVQHEMQAYLLGHTDRLGAAVPYRNYVAQARLGVSEQQHEAFFREMLADIDEPTLPFGLQTIEDDGASVDEADLTLDAGLSRRLRARARQLGVSPASVFHLAWARVLSVVAHTDRVVFGTVMMGRMQGGDGADRALGMFINTLPLRVDIDGQAVQAAVKATHASLSGLLGHEHASLALAQRCSSVAHSTPLFSALLNYRHSAVPSAAEQAEYQYAWRGIDVIDVHERTNYPLSVSVNDLGEQFSLSALAVAAMGAEKICVYFNTVIEQLVDALEHTPSAPLNGVSMLPQAERHQVLQGFNRTARDYPHTHTLHVQFEAHAAANPQALAAVHGEQSL